MWCVVGGGWWVVGVCATDLGEPPIAARGKPGPNRAAGREGRTRRKQGRGPRQRGRAAGALSPESWP